jgi:YgiT-type zinc finger domain-containing protein
MECLYCKGKMVKAQAPLSLERRQYHIYWKELPAWVCTQCGEAYFEVTSNISEEIAYVPA